MDDDEVPMAVPLSEKDTAAAAQALNQLKATTPAEHINVPVTLVTGFLGAGKTSLVRHVLTGDHGLRIAVIMNEFGDSVEESYFETPEGKTANLGEWIGLANGCLCCQVKTEFVQAIEALMSQETRTFDYILIETTGLADPGPVAASLWTDKDLEAGVQLDSIITVVDALNINRQLHDPRPEGVVNEAQVQIAYADMILLNKMDLCDEEAVVRAEADIRAINSSVTISRTTKCEVNLSQILNRQFFSPEALDVIAEDGEGEEDAATTTTATATAATTATVTTTSAGAPPTPPRRGRMPDVEYRDHASRHDDVHSGSGRKMKSRNASRSRSESRSMHSTMDGHQHHDSDIRTITLLTKKPLDLEKYKSFMDKLLWDRDTHPEDIYRVKGELNIAGSDFKHVVQAVYELYSITESCKWGLSEARQSRVVVVGRHLKKDTLATWLAECECAEA